MTRRQLAKRILLSAGLIFLLFAVGLLLYVQTLFRAPTTFTHTKSFEVVSGMSVRDIALAAQEQGIVRSNLLLYTILTYSYDPTNIYAGTYVFPEPIGVFGVAQKLADKDIENKLVSVTIPEGVRLTDIATIAAKALPEFSIDEYLIATHELEGKLFPETYFVPETFTAQDLVDLQHATYEENVAPLREAIASSLFTEWEIITLASILEREANDETSMKMVSGILRNRLEIGMPLQADATIEYVLETPLHELPAGQLASELREKDSPYNTYLYKGLTPTPIGNPGLMAVKAAIDPTPSEYLFYITGNDGEFYYAETLHEHNQNISQYLR